MRWSRPAALGEPPGQRHDDQAKWPKLRRQGRFDAATRFFAADEFRPPGADRQTASSTGDTVKAHVCVVFAASAITALGGAYIVVCSLTWVTPRPPRHPAPVCRTPCKRPRWPRLVAPPLEADARSRLSIPGNSQRALQQIAALRRVYNLNSRAPPPALVYAKPDVALRGSPYGLLTVGEGFDARTSPYIRMGLKMTRYHAA